MKSDSKNTLKSKLNADLDDLMSNNSFNPEEHFMNDNELPDLKNFIEVDYEKEIEDAELAALSGIQNLAQFYLNDPNTIKKSYIQYKIKQDAVYHATLQWMIKMGKTSMIDIKKQMDAGESGPRMYEVLSMLHREMRENIKMAKSSLDDLQGFYKKLIEDIKNMNLADLQTSETDNNRVIDTKQLNQLLENFSNNKNNDDFSFE